MARCSGVAAFPLHDGAHVAAGVEQNAAVPGGVGEARGDQCGASVAGGLSVDQTLERGGREQRTIAVENHQETLVRDGVAAGHHGMAGAALLLLQDETHTAMRQRGLDLVGLMTHDNRDVLLRGERGRGVHHVLHQGQAPGAMQHLGALRFHAGAFARRENHHADVRSHCCCLLLRPCCARSMAMAAAAGELWRILSSSHSRLAPSTSTPSSRRQASSFTTGWARSTA